MKNQWLRYKASILHIGKLFNKINKSILLFPYRIRTVMMICIILTSCGGSSTPYTPVTYTAPVSYITIKGDSMAAGWPNVDYWSQWNTTVENDGIPGADMNYLINNTVEHRSLKTVAIWAGYNTLKHPEISVATALSEYSAYVNKLTFTKLICVGVPFSNTMCPLRIQAFNDGVKLLCPNYIDVSDIKTSDGVHPTLDGYLTVGQRIQSHL